MALVLTRKIGETLRIGEAIVTVTRASDKRIVLSIEAPQEVKILRGEVAERDEAA